MYQIPIITEIPFEEQKEFDALIKKYRESYIRNSKSIVENIYDENRLYHDRIVQKQISETIRD